MGNARPGDVPLQTLLAAPEKYADREVTVTGLFLLGPSVGYSLERHDEHAGHRGQHDVSKNGAIAPRPSRTARPPPSRSNGDWPMG